MGESLSLTPTTLQKRVRYNNAFEVKAADALTGWRSYKYELEKRRDNMLLNHYSNPWPQFIGAGLVLTIATAEIGPYALDKFHISHLDVHNHPQESNKEPVPMIFYGITTNATVAAFISGDR